MTEDEFVQRVFEIAVRQGLSVELRRPGRSICFNPKSNKWLNENHLRKLYPEALESALSVRRLNRMIDSVAPGRPCTHVGFRAIITQLHFERDSALSAE